MALLSCVSRGVVQEGEAEPGTFKRPEICPPEPDSHVSRHQRRYSGAALWRSLMPNRHYGAHTVDSQAENLCVMPPAGLQQFALGSSIM